MSTALTVSERRKEMVDSVKEQMDTVHSLMSGAMVRGEDYGVIPGTGTKPTLLKPGAEKLCVLFRLSTRITTTMRELGNSGHREYETKVTLQRREEEGEFFGEGVGTCSTLESKYRYRNGQRICPACGKAAIIKGKAEYGGGWLCFTKKDGCGAKFPDGDRSIENQAVGKIENPDIADSWNTVMKMSKKRAFIDAVLTATGVSQIFTQDLEDMHAEAEPEPTNGHKANGNHKPEPQKQATNGTHKPAPKSEADGGVRWITADEWQGLKDRCLIDNLDPRKLLEHFKIDKPGRMTNAMLAEALTLCKAKPDWLRLPPREPEKQIEKPEPVGATAENQDADGIPF